MSHRGKRVVALMVAAVAAAAVAAPPVRASARQFLNTDLSISRVTLPASGDSLTAIIRITNNGPDSLPFDSYAVRVNWGFFVRKASTSTACVTIDAWSCEFQGLPVDYVDGPPLPGPRSVEYRVTLTGTPPPGERRFVGVEIIQLDYLDTHGPDRTELPYFRP